ncbi:hypothetical protein CXB51_007417 [Gossypium anomalum]|uniref:Uncharacterized protein n=1 Tax=Gossypium anomalum TaxID=47600 RepID=A0A8J5ZAK2_9ROSI|nr:hypothetical protein CXB51_007417 [Gossypium anomalum]
MPIAIFSSSTPILKRPNLEPYIFLCRTFLNPYFVFDFEKRKRLRPDGKRHCHSHRFRRVHSPSLSLQLFRRTRNFLLIIWCRINSHDF